MQPQLFGICLITHHDCDEAQAWFRMRPPPQANLREAQWHLRQHPRLPERIQKHLVELAQQLLASLPKKVTEHLLISVKNPATGYFFPVRMAADTLLSEHQILGIPAFVFGSKRADITFLSSLSLAS